MKIVETSKTAQDIQQIFSQIAPAYDKANTVLSFGIHHLWKKTLVEWSGAKAGDAVLDCATGTGDLAIQFKKVVGSSGGVIGSDFCKEMLVVAPLKAHAAHLDIKFEHADVTALPYPDQSFDVVSIAFGIRNVPSYQVAMRELHRVTKPGGVLMILEFGQPQAPVFKQLFSAYSKYILPKVGGLLSGNQAAYKYLEESSARFPSGNNFVEVLNAEGNWQTIDCKSLSGGIAYIYKARKL